MTGVGTVKVSNLIEIVRDENDESLLPAARFALSAFCDQIVTLNEQIGKFEHEIIREAGGDADMRRLMTIPAVGSVTAASIKALVPDPQGFVSGRHFAAWLGIEGDGNAMDDYD